MSLPIIDECESLQIELSLLAISDNLSLALRRSLAERTGDRNKERYRYGLPTNESDEMELITQSRTKDETPESKLTTPLLPPLLPPPHRPLHPHPLLLLP